MQEKMYAKRHCNKEGMKMRKDAKQLRYPVQIGAVSVYSQKPHLVPEDFE